MKIVLDGLTNAPLTMQLESALKSAIARGLYKPGDVLPSMHDLASECHTSVRVPRTALAAPGLAVREDGARRFVEADVPEAELAALFWAAHAKQGFAAIK